MHHQIQFPPFYSRCQKVRSISCQIRIYRFPKERLALETPDCKKTVQIDAHCTDLICNTDTLAHRRVAQLVGTWQLCWEDMEREAPSLKLFDNISLSQFNLQHLSPILDQTRLKGNPTSCATLVHRNIFEILQ